MSDIANRVCSVLQDRMVSAGLSLREIHDDPAVDAEALRSNGPVPWDTYVALIERAHTTLGQHDCYLVGQGGLDLSLLRLLGESTRDPRVLYLAAADWFIPSLFSHLRRIPAADTADGAMRVIFEIPPLYRDCPIFFDGMRQAFQRLPALIGLPDAHVEMELGIRRATYTIHLPQAPGWRAWLRRLLRRHRNEMVVDIIRGLASREADHLRTVGRLHSELASRRSEGSQLALLDDLDDHIEPERDLARLAATASELVRSHFHLRGVRLTIENPPGMADALASDDDHLPHELTGQAGDLAGQPTHRYELATRWGRLGQLEVWEALDAPLTAPDECVDTRVLAWLGRALDGACCHLALLRQSRCLEEQTAARLRAESRLFHEKDMAILGQAGRQMAHEFKNLLTTINGQAEFAYLELDRGMPVRDRIQRIKAAGRQATQLVVQLLALVDSPDLVPRCIDLSAVIQQLEKTLRAQVAESLHLDLRGLATNLPQVMADPRMIESVLLLAIDRSVRTTPAGGTIRIGTKHVVAENGKANGRPPLDVWMWIEDNGRGMDPTLASRMFDPAFNMPGADGLGYKPAATFKQVQHSGGHIFAESTVGGGTRITLQLPSDDSARPVLVDTALVRGSGQVVLLIEDSSDVRDVARDALTSWGYSVLPACSPHEALELAEAHSKDILVLVTDVVMPHMDGRQLVPKIHLHCPNLLGAIYVSGYTRGGAGRFGRMPLEKAFLSKPFEPIALVSEVQRILRSQIT